MWRSDIWSGYLKGGRSGQPSSFSSAYGEWTVPAISSTSTDLTAQVVVWIGIGGGGPYRGLPDTGSVIQIGTGAYYDKTSKSPRYYAWWETIEPSNPLPEQPISNTIMPGDQIKAFVNQLNGSLWLVGLINDTQNWVFAQKVTYNGDITTAEFIVEAPQTGIGPGRTVLPLANYGEVRFDNCLINGQNPNFDLGDWGEMYPPYNPNKTISRPGAPDRTPDLNIEGDGFYVVYGHIYPGAPIDS